MKNLKNLLLVLTDDITNINDKIIFHLSDIDSVDGLVDIDILKDYKSKLIADVIHLNHEAEKNKTVSHSLKKDLHNLMCFYSEFVDRSITLIRKYSVKGSNIACEVNMSGVNTLLFKVLHDIRKIEKHQKVAERTTVSTNIDKRGYDIDGVVLV